MRLQIKSREKTIFSGEVTSVTALNNVGEFDILDKHANFITMIKSYIVVDKGLVTENKVEISSGVLKVSKNVVEIFVYA